MRVELVTAWYNEEILAPIFLTHYKWVDRIHILLDADTNDNTRHFINEANNVNVLDITYPDGIDWMIKSACVNTVALALKCDWVIAVDADEFIWFKGYHPYETKQVLEKQTGTVIRAELHNVYRHKTDEKLLPYILPIHQRRHGNPIAGESYDQKHYIKPCVVKPEARVRWSCGCHGIEDAKNIIMNDLSMIGAHWCMADPDLAISRRLQQRARQSESNKLLNHGYQNFDITKEKILEECQAHLNDPVIF